MKEYHYLPDGWKIIKIRDTFKVFASWRGSYLKGDEWRLNSGIKIVEQDDNFYYAHGWSGSIYALDKNTENLLTLYNRAQFNSIIEQIRANDIVCGLPLMKDVISEINQ